MSNGTRRSIASALAVLIIALLSGCTTSNPAEAARSELSAVVDRSIAEFNKNGGSETISDGSSQYALIYDPAAPAAKQVVTVDLSDANSPAFGDVSAITIRSMRTLLDSAEFAEANVERSGDSFTVSGEAFGVTVNTRNGLITQIDLSAGAENAAPTQVILVTYGITPEAQNLFDSAK